MYDYIRVPMTKEEKKRVEIHKDKLIKEQFRNVSVEELKELIGCKSLQ